MTTHTIKLCSERDRQKAYLWLVRTPKDWLVSFNEPKRTVLQNKKLWAMLNDIAASEPMGRKHTAEDWKAIFMNACGWEVMFLDGLDGRPFPGGFRSSRMSTKQMGDLIDYMQAFGDENGVRWRQRLQYD